MAGKQGMAPKTKRPPAYNQITVRWHASATAFKPVDALRSLADSLGYHVTIESPRKAGRETMTIDTPLSAVLGRRRKSKLISPAALKILTRLVYAAANDPERAPMIEELAGRLTAGEDVSDELLALVKPAAHRDDGLMAQ